VCARAEAEPLTPLVSLVLLATIFWSNEYAPQQVLPWASFNGKKILQPQHCPSESASVRQAFQCRQPKTTKFYAEAISREISVDMFKFTIVL